MNNVLLFFIGNAIFLFPIYVSVYSITSDKYNFVFSVCIFGLPTIGGYATREGLKFYVHMSKKKAFFFDLGKFIKDRKKMFKIKGITPIECRSVIKMGIENSLVYILPEMLIITQTLPSIVRNVKPYLKIKTDYIICSSNILFLFNKFSFVFNLFSLNAMLFNSLVKKAVKKIGRKKSSG